MSHALIEKKKRREGEDLSFQTLFLTFAEKYYTDSENITAEDKNVILNKLNIPLNEYDESAHLFNRIFNNLNSEFRKIFAVKQTILRECKTQNDKTISKNEDDSIFPMMIIEHLSIQEEKVSKIVNERIVGETDTINDIEGCHLFKQCTAKLKNGQTCRNPSLIRKSTTVFGDFCGRHLDQGPNSNKEDWINTNKKTLSADNIFQKHTTHTPIGESLIIEFNNADKPDEFKFELEHTITIQVGRNKQTYNLVGLIFHVSASHYVSHIKRGNTWYFVDDSVHKELTVIQPDKVFKYKTKTPPYMVFYTKGKTKAIPPVRLLQTGNTCYFDCLIDTLLGLQSVRNWVDANSNNYTRKERHRRRAHRPDVNMTKKNRRNDQNDDQNDGENDGENDDQNDDQNDNQNISNRPGEKDKDTNEDKREICDKKISFNRRKRGDIDCSLNVSSHNWKIGMYDQYDYKNSGRQYLASDPVFKVQGQDKPDPLWLPDIINEPTTYIYIISKTINKETFYKIGEGGKGSGGKDADSGTGRLGNAQTYLIPGSIDAGFLVHYLMFFRKDFHIDSKYIGQHVEKQIHATLQTLFPAASITFSSSQASEWYSIKENERNFFFGFVFDIIGSFHLDRIKPLEITRVSPDGKDEKIKLPSTKDISERMNSNAEYIKVKGIIDQFNLRYMRSHDKIFIDRNNQDEIKEHLAVLSDTYINKDPVTLSKPIFKGTHIFIVTEIKRHPNYRQHTGLNNRLIYVTLQPSIPSDKITTDKAVPGFETISKPIYYVEVHLFLENLKPFVHYTDERKEKLEDIYNFFKNHYQDNQSEVPLPAQFYPSYFLKKPFQDKCGTNFMKEGTIGQYHDDYSVEIDNNADADEHEDTNQTKQPNEVTNPTEKIYSWKVVKYENQMIGRKKCDAKTHVVLDDTIEFISVLRLMKIAEVLEMKHLKNTTGTGPKNPWRRQSWKEEVKSVIIDGQSYQKGDTVLIDDSQFVNDKPSTESNGRLTYIITAFYNDTNLDTTLNPVIVVKEKIKGEQIKRDQESKYTSANPDVMIGHIEMVKPGRDMPPVEPAYKERYILKINEIKDLYDDIPPLSNNNELAKKWKGVHYVKIVNLTKLNYGVSFFPPYDIPSYWHSNQKEKNYIIDIPIEKLERHSKQINNNDRALEQYKRKLPFQITGVEAIISHLPKNANRGNVQTYRVKWAATNGIVIEPVQSKENIENFAKTQADLYWQKKSTPIDAYNADHIEDEKEKNNFARENVQRIVTNKNRPENLRRAFTLTIDTDHGFKIGDMFLIDEVFYFLSYFTTDLESNDGSSYKYGLCEPAERNKGRVKEFTFRRLLDELGKSTIKYFSDDIPQVRKEYFQGMTDRYNNLLREEQNRLPRNTRKKTSKKPSTKKNNDKPKKQQNTIAINPIRKKKNMTKKKMI